MPGTAVESRPVSLPAIPSDDDTGLEDFDTNVIPRLSIKPNGVFVNNLTNEEHTSLDVVILGLVRQRVLWSPEIKEDAEKPLCRSLDGFIGRPTDAFPTKAAAGVASNDDGTLDCSSCPLKEWGSHPTRDVPWCSEQYVLPLLIDGEAPALLTLQRSALKNTNAYLSDFKRRKTGAFTHVTTLTLETHKRGSVEYATPSFKKGEETDAAYHGGYRMQFKSIREFLTTPRAEDEDGSSSSTPSASSSSSSTPSASSVTIDASASPAVVLDDEVPF